MRPGLLVIDVQNRWLETDKGLMGCLEPRIGTINEAISLFRKHGRPLIAVYHEDEGEGPRPGTRDFEFDPRIKVEGTDAKVIKHYPDAFNRTKLPEMLREAGCDSVVLCGLSGTWCVLGTFWGAINHDLVPYFLRDGVVSGTEAQIRFVEETYDTLSTRALGQILEKD